ncbi:photosynthetic reaction center cytochrome PufC [Roseomonas sp. CCTCC AB2023176]|uniref:photosynthetic reaction center cytochrome PufC n=1 Tax=Roseomonas sp. CCTCC AB2023176 TaxID=3342640 RepID=UPI0035D99D96
MPRYTFLGIGVGLAALVALAIVLLTFERPPVLSVQQGYRGTGMAIVYNPRLVEAQAARNVLPETLEAQDDEGPRASEIYQNVQVLGNLSAGQFGRIMQAMVQWVAPEETTPGGGCNYCHNPNNFADDYPYTKVVARRMLQMTQQINAQHANHVGQTGVTCYTCHRGNPVPAYNWSTPAPNQRFGNFAAVDTGQNRPSAAAGLASLPLDPFTPFLLNDAPIRVNSDTDLRSGNRASIKQTEWTYSLMTHYAEALGVGCTHCHNSRQFSSWAESTPQRVTAWYAQGMLRDVNRNYIENLRPVFPANRLGPAGEPLMANCATCHQGAYKPLYGASMLRDYQELNRVVQGPTEVRRLEQ